VPGREAVGRRTIARVIGLPTLDAHAHIDARRHPDGLGDCGVVLAQTFSLEDAERSNARYEPTVAWGAGCHPRLADAQAAFDRDRFRGLLARTAIVGEVGLDAGSHVPRETQLATFRAVLEIVADQPRILSIHSHRSTRQVLDELRRTPIVAPILHWWTGTAAETSEAVELGCRFSVHAAVARQSKWRSRVPLDRILVETDHGWRDPPGAIPLRVGWVEHLVAQQYGITPAEVRQAAWRNFAAIVAATGTSGLLPPGIVSVLGAIG
jgi:TatD DNase family protein